MNYQQIKQELRWCRGHKYTINQFKKEFKIKTDEEYQEILKALLHENVIRHEDIPHVVFGKVHYKYVVI